MAIPKALSMAPSSFALPSVPLCLSAHGSQPHLAAGLITGGVHFVSDPLGRPGCGATLCRTTCSTRSVCLTAGVTATQVFAGGADGALRQADVASGGQRCTPTEQRASYGLTAVACLGPPSDRPVLAIGDDDGGVRLVDSRGNLGLPALVLPKSSRSRVPERYAPSIGTTSATPVRGLVEQADYISALLPLPQTSYLFAASGDGTLCLYDVRMERARLTLTSVSDEMTEDLLCLAAINDNRRLVCGTLTGSLQTYTVESFTKSCEQELRESHMEDFPGHPASVNCVAEMDPHGLVVTGCDDGIVRVIDLGPFQCYRRELVGVAGSVEGEVQDFAWVGGHKGLLVVASSEEKVSFIDLNDEEGTSVEEEESEESRMLKARPREIVDEDQEFWEEEFRGRRKRRKKGNGNGMKAVEKTYAKKNDFFGGL